MDLLWVYTFDKMQSNYGGSGYLFLIIDIICLGEIHFLRILQVSKFERAIND